MWNTNVLRDDQAASVFNILERLRAAGRLDMVGLVEIGRNEPPPLEGFVWFHGAVRRNRSLLGAGRGQGMALAVRSGLSTHCKKMKCTDHTLWVKVAQPGYATVFVCLVYIPPATSRVEWSAEQRQGWKDVFSGLQADITHFSLQGEVCLLGDFNAHTGTLDDRGSLPQQLLDDLGVMGGPAAHAVLPARQNSDTACPCQFGKLLVDLCVATDCVILNGRAPGDESGAFTFESSGGQGSVIDYGIVSRACFPWVYRFLPVPRVDSMSDHCMLLCVIELPRIDRAYNRSAPAFTEPVKHVRWDPAKREQYVGRLLASSCLARRKAIIDSMSMGTVSFTEGCAAWCELIKGTAVEVFGASSGSDNRMPSGRAAKPWFVDCQQEWLAMKAVIRQGDTHAAAAARRAFAYAKRRAQRRHNKYRQAKLLDDLKHNPRRFWTEYRGRKGTAVQHSMAVVTDHWRALYGATGQHSLPECATSVSAFVTNLVSHLPTEENAANAAELNNPLTVEEVESALLKMHNGRMAGPDGLRGELFKGAYTEVKLPEGHVKHIFHLSQDLCDIYNAAFSRGQVPKEWCEAFLSAVFKSGDSSVLDNYRGIAVGSAMGKLYSMIIESRLSRFCEEHGHRAQGQAGFRDGHRTSDNVFVLKHLIDKYRSKKKHLFVCFVDFRKAYDLVRRDLLMKCLADIGLRGEILTAIVSMYWNAPMRPKLGPVAGPAFDSTRGVKQGDPLSPLLFGIFIDRIERWLAERAPSCGADLGQQLVRMLLYADDLALLAESETHLQQLLDALWAFCAEYDMEVNVRKTEIVVFGHVGYTGNNLWRYGNPSSSTARPVVQASESFKYLGVVFHQTKGFSACIDTLEAAGKRAMWAMLSRCREHGISSLSMQVHLFHTLVSPILNYCSEVWAPALLARSGEGADLVTAVLNNDLQQVQHMFLRVLGHLRRSTSVQLMLREFGCRPLVYAWFRSVVGMWNRVTKEGHNSLLQIAVQENLGLSKEGDLPAYRQRLWCHNVRLVWGYLHAFCQQRPGCGLDTAGLLTAFEGFQPIEAEVALQAFDLWFFQQWHNLPGNPRTASSAQVTCCTYEQWFAAQPFIGLDMADPTSWCSGLVRHTSGMNPAHVCSLLRFRLNAHSLRVATGRWQHLPRPQRVCERCTSGLVEDEFHMIFECPAYDCVRERFCSLFTNFGEWQDDGSLHCTASPTGREMARFMQQHPPVISAFIHACYVVRQDPEMAEVFLTDFCPSDSECSDDFLSATSLSDAFEWFDALDNEFTVDELGSDFHSP